MATKSKDSQIAVTKMTVTKTAKLKDGIDKIDTTEETLEVHKFATTPASVHVHIPLKLSMDYQSLGIEIGVTRPCYIEEMDAAFKLAYDAAFKKIQEHIPEIKQTLAQLTGRTQKVLTENKTK